MKKRMMVMIMAAVMTVATSMTAFAGSWQKNDTGWWWQNDDGSWPATSWQWLDGNNDGVAECYWFDSNGYMAANTTTPDGYTVDANGAWTVDGVVQTKQTGAVAVADDGGYNEWGVSNTALEMYNNTREQNAKYGEVKVLDDMTLSTAVWYSNGFLVHYSKGASFYKTVQAVDVNGNRDEKKLFKFYDSSVSSGDEAVDYLVRKGFDKGAHGDHSCYADYTTVWITAGNGVLNWNFHKSPSVLILR